MAAADAADAEPEAFEQAVLFERFHGIMGAGGREPALGSQQRRNDPLVHTDDRYKGKG